MPGVGLSIGPIEMVAHPAITDPRQLSHRVIFITHQLGLYHAELARVLHLRCADIGQLVSGKTLLQRETTAWRQACLWVEFYETLSGKLQGDEVAMYHWLRAENSLLGGVPLLLLVDDDRLLELVEFLVENEVIR